MSKDYGRERVEHLHERKLDEQIVRLMKGGEKSSKELKLGVEIEHIVVNRENFSSVTYYGEQGIEGLLENLLEQGEGYEGVYEEEHLVGLKTRETDITLEPGGQLEFATRPCLRISYLRKNYEQFLEEISPILDQRNQSLLGIGYHPVTKISEIPFNPKKRYQWMSEYLRKRGDRALNMMKGTAALQVTIDYMNEEDYSKKFRVANYLIPILYLLSDNAPFFEGEIYRKQGLRAMIWENTDKDRAGIVPNGMKKNYRYKDYAEYLKEIPAICIKKDGELVSTGDRKIKELYEKREDIGKEETEHLLTMVFPDVRCKNYIEIRVADSMPKDQLFAYVAMLKGLFYHEENLNTLYQQSLDCSIEDVVKGKEEMINKGFEGRYLGRSFKDLAVQLIELSKSALEDEERLMLRPLEQRVNRGKTMREEILAGCKENTINGLSRLEIKPDHQ